MQGGSLYPGRPHLLHPSSSSTSSPSSTSRPFISSSLLPSSHPQPRVPSICTGRWLDDTSYLHATPPPWQTTNLHRGRGLPPQRVSLWSLAQTLWEEKPRTHMQTFCLFVSFERGATLSFFFLFNFIFKCKF